MGTPCEKNYEIHVFFVFKKNLPEQSFFLKNLEKSDTDATKLGNQEDNADENSEETDPGEKVIKSDNKTPKKKVIKLARISQNVKDKFRPVAGEAIKASAKKKPGIQGTNKQ